MKLTCKYCGGTGIIKGTSILYICTLGLAGFFKFKCKKCKGKGYIKV